MLVRTNIYLPKNTLDKLKQKAKEHHTSVSELIRQFIEKEEYKYTQPKGTSGLLLLADKLSKQKFVNESEESISDHDRYLYEEHTHLSANFLKELKEKQRKK